MAWVRVVVKVKVITTMVYCDSNGGAIAAVAALAVVVATAVMAAAVMTMKVEKRDSGGHNVREMRQGRYVCTQVCTAHIRSI